MSIEQMAIRLEKWERFAWLCLGMSVALLAVSIMDVFLYPHGVEVRQYFGWLFLWTVFQFVPMVTTVVLVWGKDWQTLPIGVRFYTVFEYLAADWIVLLSFGLHLCIQFFFSPEPYIFIILLVGAVLLGIFFYLRKKYITTPESLFP